MIRSLLHKVFPSYLHILRKSVGNSETLLDVGCGSDSPIQHLLKKPRSVGVDAFEPSIEKSRSKNIHSSYHNSEITEVLNNFGENSFECVLANDVIEHFSKESGIKLIEDLEKISSRTVIIFTPNGFLYQAPFDNNPWQEHISGWDVEEMREYGYTVLGVNGWKALRGEKAKLKYSPKWFFGILSAITQLYTYKYPKHAAQILCVKKK